MNCCSQGYPFGPNKLFGLFLYIYKAWGNQMGLSSRFCDGQTEAICFFASPLFFLLEFPSRSWSRTQCSIQVVSPWWTHTKDSAYLLLTHGSLIQDRLLQVWSHDGAWKAYVQKRGGTQKHCSQKAIYEAESSHKNWQKGIIFKVI